MTSPFSMQNDRWLQAQFIDLYRDRPCLWDPKHKHYRDKMRRLLAYQELLEIYKQADPEATVDSVRNKLNTLRTLYNREKKKLMGRGQTASGLWYYDKLDSFLGDIINPTLDTGGGGDDTANLKYDPPAQRRRQTIITENIKLEVLPAGRNTAFIDESYTQESEKDDTDSNPLEHVSVHMGNRDNSSAQGTSNSGIEILQYDDEFAAFATVIAASLRKLNNPQQAIAQKLISDVIFYSKLDKLTEDTTISIPKHDTEEME